MSNATAACIKELVKGGLCRATAKPDTKDGAYCHAHDPDRAAQKELDHELARLRESVEYRRSHLGYLVERAALAKVAFEELYVLEEAMNESLSEGFNPEKVKALTALATELRLSRDHRRELALDVAQASGLPEGAYQLLEAECLSRFIASGRKFSRVRVFSL